MGWRAGRRRGSSRGDRRGSWHGEPSLHDDATRLQVQPCGRVRRSMLLAALVPIVATALGTALGLGAQSWHRRILEPVRSFALAAVTVTIAVHLMPHAVEEAGAWALVIFA